jgi:putative flavoprotein involved in K+ transport
MSTLDCVVVGGGASGLATAYRLARAGLSHAVIDQAHEPGGSWPRFYDSLTLFSPARYSSLPGLAFGGNVERYPHRDEVVGYLRRYAAHFDIPFHGGRQVEMVQRHEGAFRVSGAAGDYRARSVVVATGAFSEPFMPDMPGMNEFEGRLLHSAGFRNAEDFRGSRVVVVGAGNSAVQIAVELARTARVTLATRAPVRFLPQRMLGQDIHFWLRVSGLDFVPVGPAYRTPVLDAGHYLSALRRGKPEWRPLFRGFNRSGVEWTDGTSEQVDTVVFATGFRPRYPFLADMGATDSAGRVQHRGGASTRVPGLYFMGLVGQRNHASATLRGAGSDSRAVVRHLTNYLPGRP